MLYPPPVIRTDLPGLAVNELVREAYKVRIGK